MYWSKTRENQSFSTVFTCVQKAAPRFEVRCTVLYIVDTEMFVAGVLPVKSQVFSGAGTAERAEGTRTRDFTHEKDQREKSFWIQVLSN